MLERRYPGRAGCLAVVVLLGSATDARAEIGVGQLAPWFELPSLAGPRVSRRALAGKVGVLVIGRTRPAAPRCKDWTTRLIRRAGATVYQVIVLDKPWYAPRSAVLAEVKKFTGPDHHGRVLLEWYTVFADAYGIPRDDDPRLVVLDRRGLVRLVLRGAFSKERMAALDQTLLRLRSSD